MRCPESSTPRSASPFIDSTPIYLSQNNTKHTSFASKVQFYKVPYGILSACIMWIFPQTIHNVCKVIAQARCIQYGMYIFNPRLTTSSQWRQVYYRSNKVTFPESYVKIFSIIGELNGIDQSSLVHQSTTMVFQQQCRLID